MFAIPSTDGYFNSDRRMTEREQDNFKLLLFCYICISTNISKVIFYEKLPMTYLYIWLYSHKQGKLTLQNAVVTV